MNLRYFGVILLTSFTLAFVSCGGRRLVLTQPQKKTQPEKRPDLVITGNTLSNRSTADSYIERFKGIAIEEMVQSGIPASITLAQGLLESGNGNSSLAREANNHFGIKCTPEWKGKTVLKDDDKVDDCFRVYSSPEESFRDHSEFLKRKRYASLFELDRNDYKGWATGLKAAGYATNPRYAELLISLIERYDLTQFDRAESRTEKIKREDRVLAEIAEHIPEEKKEVIPAKEEVAMIIYEVKAGDTLAAIAKRFSLTVQELKILNDLGSEEVKLGQLLLVSK